MLLGLALASLAGQTPPPLPRVPPRVLRSALPSPQPVARERWITAEDYPIAAVRRDAMGSVFYRLEVDSGGRPRRCEIERSSGDAELDETTCSLLLARARFRPGRHDGSYRSSLHWRLPPGDEMPFTTIRTVTYFTVAPSGAVDCQYRTGELRPEPMPAADCEGIGVELRAAGVPGLDAGARVALRATVIPDGAPAPPAASVEGRRLFAMEIAFELLPDGRLGRCELVAADPAGPATALGGACGLFWAIGLNDEFVAGPPSRRGRLRGEVIVQSD